MNSPATLELERTAGVPAVSDKGQEGRAVSPALCPKQTQEGGEELPSLDIYGTTARTPSPDTDDKVGRRVRRFYQRYFTGVRVGGALRVLTLTSSDKAVEEGYNIHKHFRALVMRLRRRWGRFEYIGVKEVKGDRQHLHLVFRGEFMAQVQVSAMWRAIHASPVVDIQAVWGSRGGARYLAKYLAKAVASRYWASYNWVFQGWVGWSKRVKRAYGCFPSAGLLQALARLDRAARQALTSLWGCDIYIAREGQYATSSA